MLIMGCPGYKINMAAISVYCENYYSDRVEVEVNFNDISIYYFIYLLQIHSTKLQTDNELN